MALAAAETRRLRALAHHKKPVVQTGNAGMSEAVLREIDLALEHHELIKIRIQAEDRDQRKQMVDTACTACTAELVQMIGHIAILYRKSRT